MQSKRIQFEKNLLHKCVQWAGKVKISHLFNRSETKWSKKKLFAYLYCYKSSIRITMIENNNVYKIIWKNGNKEYNEKYICCFFTVWYLKRAITSNCGRAVLSHSSVYFAISNFILLFSYSFHMPCIILSNVYFYIARPMFPFLFNRSQSTASTVNQLSHLFFEALKYFCSFQIFEKGHIQNVVSTLINIVKLDAQNNNICFDVV